MEKVDKNADQDNDPTDGKKVQACIFIHTIKLKKIHAGALPAAAARGEELPIK